MTQQLESMWYAVQALGLALFHFVVQTLVVFAQLAIMALLIGGGIWALRRIW